MRRTRGWIVLPGLLVFCAAQAFADAKPAPMKPNPGFDKLKALVGAWQGTSKDGKPVTVSYALVSDGSALMEDLGHGTEMNMITMYNPDGDRLMMTHYCGSHNQPRMRAEMFPDGKSLKFTFLDATNLASPDAGHMDRLVVSFQDPDHFTQEWTWTDKGASNTEVFHFARKK